MIKIWKTRRLFRVGRSFCPLIDKLLWNLDQTSAGFRPRSLLSIKVLIPCQLDKDLFQGSRFQNYVKVVFITAGILQDDPSKLPVHTATTTTTSHQADTTPDAYNSAEQLRRSRKLSARPRYRTFHASCILYVHSVHSMHPSNNALVYILSNDKSPYIHLSYEIRMRII